MTADASSPVFHRRVHTLFGFVMALVRLVWEGPRILALHLSGRRLRPRWRESLWLAVSEVNGCRFCTYIHEGMAGRVGLSADDIDLLLASSDGSSRELMDEHEWLAVAYAKIWAESRGYPPQGLTDQLRDTLSHRQRTDLHALLRVIDFANRSGNTLDSLLHRLRHPRRLLQPWGLVNDLIVGFLVALFGWPALVAGAVQRWRNGRHPGAPTSPRE